jgi:hypothetical protein
VCVRLGLRGGKGGFGSMLRAMGAMKSGKETDNIDACRGLDGRRLRHVQGEAQIAEWIAKEPERQAEKVRGGGLFFFFFFFPLFFSFFFFPLPRLYG